MLATKLISGSVIATTIILSILWFQWAWLLMVIALSLIGTWELARMLQGKGIRVSFVLPAALNLLLLLGVYFLADLPTEQPDPQLRHTTLSAWMHMYVVFAGLTLLLRNVFLKPRATLTEMSAPFFQLAWLGWFPAFFILIRTLPGGPFFLIWALTTVAFSDIGGYFAGKYLGKHPYFQHLSPNKTIEGAIGGILGSVAIGMGLSAAFGSLLPLPLLHVVLLAAGMACVGQMGDLIESMVKRDMDVKDSGTWLPGFGGLLDRIDSYLLLAPFLYYYLVSFVSV